MVPFHDLRRRVNSLRPGLEARLARVLDAGHYILGPSVEEFERAFSAYCGARYGIGVGSGTDAIWLTLEALGVGAGDEVITVSNTCAPTAAAILKCGATPVLVDVEPGTLTMDPACVEAAIGPKTKVILPVHLYGQCADMKALRAIADRRGLFLVEDCAQAHGAEFQGRRAGSLGHAACFSFYPTKNLGAIGDAGMILTDDPRLAESLRLLRQYGYEEPNKTARTGHNSRLDELQAAFLLEALPHLDGWNDRRRAIAAEYGAALAGGDVLAPVERAGSRHAWHLYVVRSKERARLQESLSARGIGTMIHYPIPIHRQKGYAELCRVAPGGLAVTELAAAEILSLPLYPKMTEAEVSEVAAAVGGRVPA